jgi:hypothetical protein
MSPSPLNVLDDCLHGYQEQEVFVPNWLKVLSFPDLDQHIIARLVWVNRKVKWRSLC